MKVQIMTDSQFGNGKKLAEKIRDVFPSEYSVLVADVKDVSPETVAKNTPEILILGGAIRMFRGDPKSRKWLKQFDKILDEFGKKISYATGFLTHGLPTDKVQGFAKRYLKKIKKTGTIDKIYSELLTARVETQEGPIYPEEMTKAVSYTQEFVNWIKKN